MEADQASVDLFVPIFNDGLLEGSETFRVVLFGADPGLQIDAAANSALVTVQDDEARIDISSPATAQTPTLVTEGNGTDINKFSFVISRTVFTDKVSSVDWSLSSLDLSNGANDFVGATSGTVSFAAGESTKTVEIAVRADATWEAKEPFKVELSRPSAGTVLGTDITTHFDVVNDDADRYSLSAPRLQEGDSVGVGPEFTPFAITATRINSLDSGEFTWTVAASSVTPLSLDQIHADSRTGRLQFASGELSKVFNILVRKDNVGDIDRNFDIVASSPQSGDGLTPTFTQSTVTATVLNDDPVVGIHVGAVRLPNGVMPTTGDSLVFPESAVNQGALIEYVVRRSGDVSNAATVEWAVQPNSQAPATVNVADFGGFWPSGMLAFLPNEISKTIQFRNVDDAEFEPNEAFQVVLSNLNSADGGATITTTTAHGVITNDDNGVRVISLDPAVAEGDWGVGTPVTFRISVVGMPNRSVTVGYVIEGGSLMAGDSTDLSTPMGFGTRTLMTGPTGSVFQDVRAYVRGDNLYGENENIQLRITDVVNASIAQGLATVMIRNDDSLVSMQTESQFIHEGQPVGEVDGSAPLIITLNRVGDLTKAAVVDYRVSEWGDSSVSPSDFAGGVLPSGQIHFAANSATANVVLNVRSDAEFEGDESFVVRLLAPASAPAGTSPVTVNPEMASTVVTIRNDDASPLTLSVVNASVMEGNNSSNPNSLSFEASRSGDLSQAVTVNYTIQRSDASTLSASAWNSTFSQGLSGSFQIAAGESKASFSINIGANSIAEPDRQFSVRVAAVGYQGASTTAAVIDDDSGISIAAQAQQPAVEGSIAGQASVFGFVVSRAGVLGPARVSWAVNSLGINGVNAADFVAGQDVLGNQSGFPSGELVFLQGETSKTIQVRVSPDVVVENTENFSLRLLGVSLPDAAAPVQKILVASAEAKVTDDDRSSDSTADVLQGGSGVDALSGGGGNDLIQGGRGADRIFGGDGNDTVFGGGGADAIFAGAGNDLIVLDRDNIDNLTDGLLARVDGGFGVDTLRVDAANQTLDLVSIFGDVDLTTQGYGRFVSIEKIDLTGTGDNLLVINAEVLMSLNAADVFDTNGKHQLLVSGNQGDKVDVTDATGTQGWTQGPNISLESNTYHVWSHASEPVILYVQPGIAVI